jgi:hypothetical protein
MNRKQKFGIVQTKLSREKKSRIKETLTSDGARSEGAAENFLIEGELQEDQGTMIKHNQRMQQDFQLGLESCNNGLTVGSKGGTGVHLSVSDGDLKDEEQVDKQLEWNQVDLNRRTEIIPERVVYRSSLLLDEGNLKAPDAQHNEVVVTNKDAATIVGQLQSLATWIKVDSVGKALRRSKRREKQNLKTSAKKSLIKNITTQRQQKAIAKNNETTTKTTTKTTNKNKSTLQNKYIL